MDVVGHEGVSMYGTTASARRFFQPVEVTVVILLGKKTRLAVDAALDNMQGVTLKQYTWTTGHGFMLDGLKG